MIGSEYVNGVFCGVGVKKRWSLTNMTVVPESRIVVNGRLTVQAMSSETSAMDAKERSCMRLLGLVAVAMIMGAAGMEGVAAAGTVAAAVSLEVSFFLFLIQGACPYMPLPFP
jgi:hypothetical protein